MGVKSAYLGASVGKAMADVGELMFRETAREDERERERAYRAEQMELDRQTRRDLKEMGQKPTISDGDLNELAAGKLGMSVPEVQAHRDAVRTGDFKFDGYPEGISPDVISAKRKALYDLIEQYRAGEDYRPIEQGRSEAHKRGLIDRAIENPEEAPRIAQGAAAGAGRGAYGGNSDVVRNEFTGETTTTDIGRARISNLNADASHDLAKIREIEEEIKNGGLGKESSDRLTTIIEKSTSTLKQLNDNPPGRDKASREEWEAQKREWATLRERARSLLSKRLDEKEKPATPKPQVTTRPAKDYRRLWNES